MKRTLKYTGRIDIRREQFALSLNVDGDDFYFTLSRLDLDGLPGPLKPDDRVYVEAFHGYELEQFDLGPLKDLRLPVSQQVSAISEPRYCRFRILVVDPSDHKIVAASSSIAPHREKHAEGLLPFEVRNDLGFRVWRIEFTDDEGGPVLCVNGQVPGIELLARSDPFFFVQTYPQVLREILIRILFVNSVEEDLDWVQNWLRFVRSLGCPLPPHSDADPEEKWEWIEAAVDRFAEVHASCFREAIRQLEGESREHD